MEITGEQIEEGKKYFEEAVVVLESLDRQTKEFIEASKKLEEHQNKFDELIHTIDNLGNEISKKISLKSIEKNIEKSVLYLYDAEIEVKNNMKSLNDFKIKYMRTSVVIAISVMFGFVGGYAFGLFNIDQLVFSIFN